MPAPNGMTSRLSKSATTTSRKTSRPTPKSAWSPKRLSPVSPGLVSESPDRDEEGNDLGTVTKSVNYSVLYMKAVKALQEAMERIEQLEANNADLLARVSALESA
jgi:hypothetical protein